MSRTDDEIRADLASGAPFTAVPRLLADVPVLLADRDAALAVIARVSAWRDELAQNRGGWDGDIAARVTDLLDGTATCEHGEREAHQCPYGDLACPCQDGDACHYVDDAGPPATAAWPAP